MEYYIKQSIYGAMHVQTIIIVHINYKNNNYYTIVYFLILVLSEFLQMYDIIANNYWN